MMQRNDWKLIIVYILKKKFFLNNMIISRKIGPRIYSCIIFSKRLNLVMVDKRMTKDNITPQISNMTWNWKN